MSSGKAALAALRHSIGKPLGAVPDIWPIMLDDMPEKFLSHNGIETKEELNSNVDKLRNYVRTRAACGIETNLEEIFRSIDGTLRKNPCRVRH